MKLSIIIPYYNTRSLTKKLLDELNKQRGDNKEVEIILIDDYSDGWTFYDKVDKYVRLNTNGGGAHARNLGAQIAEGEYIMYIDCDDMILENYLFTLLNEIPKGNDLTWISWTSIYGDAVVQSTEQPNIAPWGCLFKRHVLDTIKFNDKLNIGEEPEFWAKVFELPDLKIGYSTNLIYYYNIREDSATRKYERGELSKER